MKKLTVLPLIACLMGASAAYAGNAEILEAAPAPAIAANDWSGFYVGGLASFDGGDLETESNGIPGAPYTLDDSTSYGGFAGYNIQRGALVFGAEVAISSGTVRTTNLPDSFYESITDIKARAGYSFGKVLAYGVVGGSFSNFDDNSVDQFASSGFSYGAGADVMLGEHMFVGAEYLVRNLSGFGEVSTDFEIIGNVQSAQLRVGWNF